MSNVVVAILQAKPGSEAKLRAAARKAVNATHAEPGNHKYALHVSKRDPARFVIVEKWEDEESLSAHFQTPHMQAFSAAVAELLAAPPTIVITDPIPVGEAIQGML